MSYAILGMESTTANGDKISYTPCPVPTTESYKFLERGLGKQCRIDYISPDGNCLFRSLSKELLGHEKFHHLIRQILIRKMTVSLELMSLENLWKITVNG